MHDTFNTVGGIITSLLSLFGDQVWLKEVGMGTKLTKDGLVTIDWAEDAQIAGKVFLSMSVRALLKNISV